MLNVHAILPGSRVNGPGTRIVVWVQGCSLRCPGCFNPETHDHAPRIMLCPTELGRIIAHALPPCEGITISGGEPLEQAPDLAVFLREVRARTDLSIVLFSGFSLVEIQAISAGRRVLEQVDVLIAGRFLRDRYLGTGLRGSSNQTIHLMTDRYRYSEVADSPSAEVTIDAQGNITLSGVDPPRL